MRKNTSLEDIKRFVHDWNIRFPIDRWWRDKHKVSFMSTVHRDSSFIDQLIEYKEDEIYDELLESYREKQKEGYVDDKYIPGKGNFMKSAKVIETMSDEDFNSIDLSKF